MNQINARMKLITAWIVGFAMLMESIDTTVINTALPSIAVSLGQDPIHLKLALTSYLLSLGVFIPVSGWIADRFGARRIFILAMLIFTLSSMGCGQARTLWELVVMRVIQGVGGAMMVPVGRLIILRLFDKGELTTVWPKIGMFMLIGPIIGPSIGGFLTEYISWRWIFYVNVPIGLVGIYLMHKCLTVPFAITKTKFDFIGFVLCGAGLAILLLACQELISDAFSMTVKISLLLSALALLVGYYFYAKRREHTVVNLQLFNLRVFSTTVWAGTLCRMGTGALPFLLPLLFQLGFGYLPLHSGLMLLPMAVGQLTVKSIVRPVLKKFGFRSVMVLTLLVMTLISLQLSWMDANVTVLVWIVVLYLYGALSSLQFSCMNLLAYADIPSELISNSTSVYSAVQQIGVSFGIAFAALILEFYLGSHDLTHSIPVAVFHQTFIWISIAMFLSALIFLRIKPQDGVAMSGYIPAHTK